jgi:hypothetical protein
MGRNHLTGIQTADLVQFLRERKAEIEADGMTNEHIAALASSTLGFPVTIHNVRRYAQQVGIDRQHVTAQAIMQRLEFVERRVAALEKAAHDPQLPLGSPS